MMMIRTHREGHDHLKEGWVCVWVRGGVWKHLPVHLEGLPPPVRQPEVAVVAERQVGAAHHPLKLDEVRPCWCVWVVWWWYVWWWYVWWWWWW